MKRVFIFVADGTEDVEFITPFDYLKRAGAEVTLIGVEKKNITTSHGLNVEVEYSLEYLEQTDLPDMVVVPGGGKGAENIAACGKISSFLKTMAENEKTVAAICASPVVVFSRLGLLKNRKYTCYPDMEKDILMYAGNDPSLIDNAVFVNDRVVSDGNIITSRGAGTAEEFSVRLIETLFGKEKASFIMQKIVAR